MSKSTNTKPPYPPGFRQQMIELVCPVIEQYLVRLPTFSGSVRRSVQFKSDGGTTLRNPFVY